MPFYDFTCPECGPFQLLRTIANRALPADCPECGSEAEREITAPHLSVMDAVNRKKWAINERSRHEPRVSQRHSCSSSCGCGTGASKKAKSKYSKFQTARAGARPWMLGH